MRNAIGSTTIKKSLLFLISAALTLGGLASCNKPQDAQTLISDAKNYEEKGDHKAAIIQLKNALQADPDNRDARYLLGTVYNKVGDFQSAEKELRRALKLGMNPAKVLPDLGQTLLDLGQFQQVLDETKQLSLEKSSAEISTLRGSALLGLGKPKEAKALFEQALQDKPDFPEALIGLAQYSLSEKDLESAMQFLDQVVTRNPENAGAWLIKGDLLRAHGDVEPALAAYDQVIKLKPNSSIAYLNKALLKIATKKYEAAKADIDAARKVVPGSMMVLYTQALLDFSQGQHKAALESLQQLLSKAPDHMPGVLLAGAVQLALGSSLQAEQHLRHYLNKDPKNLYARKLLASSLLKNGQPKGAIDVLAPALKGGQQDPQLLALTAESYMQAKDFAKATEYFDKASEMAPENAALRTALSMSMLGQGENKRAVAELEMATKLDPKSTQAGIMLATTHLRLKEFDKALAAVKTLEKEHPDNPLIQNLKGGIYLGKKDISNARASFDRALSFDPAYFPAAINLARLDLQEKKPDAAKKRFEAILAKDKKNIQAMTALSSLALKQGQKKEATTWLERAAEENPDALQPAMLLAAYYLRSGEKQKSLTLAQKLQSAHPQNPNALELLAQAQLGNNNKTAALESYTRLAAMLPESPAVQLQIASIHLANQNTSAAAEALKKSLAIKPDYLAAELTQAALESRQGNYEKAIAISRQIQKQQEKSPVGYIAEGDLLMDQKKPALAVKAYEKAFAVSKNGPAMMKLHASLSQAGQVSEANSRLILWLKEHPDDAVSRMYLAEIYLVGRQNKAAIEQYQIILKQVPTYMPALNNLATAYQQEKNPLALEYAEKAHQLAPDSPAVLDTLGWILVEQGSTARGLPFLQKAVSLAPEAAEIRYHFAAGLFKSGDKAAARKELEQLLGTGKKFPDIDVAKSMLKQMQ